MKTVYCLFLLFSLHSISSLTTVYANVKKKMIPVDYDKNWPPIKGDKPVNVNVTLHIINFRLVKEKELSFTLDIFLHLKWIDHRINLQFLNKTDLTLNSGWRNEFWIPDIYFKNGVSGNLNTDLFTTSYFIIKKTFEKYGAEVFMATRVTVEFLCDFDFKNYPHDTHKCGIDIMSLSERNNNLQLQWSDFQISKRIYNPDFNLSDPWQKDCSVLYATGTYSCIQGELILKRFMRRHFARKYTPTFLIVLTSFVGFWVPTSSYPARVSILVVSLLALITQQVQSQPVRSISTISYNIWSNFCIGFVFLALIEFAMALVWEEKNKIFKIAEQHENNKKDADYLEGDLERSKKRLRRLSHKYCPSCNPIDAYSRIIFPIFFGFFIICYSLFVTFRS